MARSSPRVSRLTANYDFALARYNTDGTLDTTFGVSGKVTTGVSYSPYASGDPSVPPTLNDGAFAVAVQADGKIVAVGESYNGANHDFAVVRYNTDGTLDTTFDVDGVVTTAIGPNYDGATAVAVQADGRILVAGYSNYTDCNDSDFAIVRYNTDGTLDTTFGTAGKVTTSVSPYADQAYAVAIQSDGKIVAAGVGPKLQ